MLVTKESIQKTANVKSEGSSDETISQTIKHYDDLLKILQNPEEDMSFILAGMHLVRLILTNINIFPNELWDKSEPDIFKLQQYVNPIADYMNDVPVEGGFNRLLYTCAKIWYFTLCGLILPNRYKEKTKKMWLELNRGTDSAYEVWNKKFYSVNLYSEATKRLLDNLEEDIKKIPAALR